MPGKRKVNIETKSAMFATNATLTYDYPHKVKDFCLNEGPSYQLNSWVEAQSSKFKGVKVARELPPEEKLYWEVDFVRGEDEFTANVDINYFSPVIVSSVLPEFLAFSAVVHLKGVPTPERVVVDFSRCLTNVVSNNWALPLAQGVWQCTLRGMGNLISNSVDVQLRLSWADHQPKRAPQLSFLAYTDRWVLGAVPPAVTQQHEQEEYEHDFEILE